MKRWILAAGLLLSLSAGPAASADFCAAPAAPGCNRYACWGYGGGCNGYGCWTNGGGCNGYGCWNTPVGSCNGYGCSDIGVCNGYGCP